LYRYIKAAGTTLMDEDGLFAMVRAVHVDSVYTQLEMKAPGFQPLNV
jgi:hypothetical protein